MKKFLTVLLALSVVFTYTVGTAFALPSDGTETAGLPQAKAEAVAELDAFDYSAYTDAGQTIAKGYVAKAKSEVEDATKIADVKTAMSNFNKSINGISSYLKDAVVKAQNEAIKQITDYVYLFGLDYDKLQAASTTIAGAIVNNGNIDLDSLQLVDDEEAFIKAIQKADKRIDGAASVEDVGKQLNSAIEVVDEYMAKLTAVDLPADKKADLVKEIIDYAASKKISTKPAAGDKTYSTTIVNKYNKIVDEAIAAAKAATSYKDYYEVINKYLGSYYSNKTTKVESANWVAGGSNIYPNHANNANGFVDVISGEGIFILEESAGELNNLANMDVETEAQIAAAQKALNALGDYNYKDIAKDKWDKAEALRLGLAKFVESGNINDLTTDIQSIISGVTSSMAPSTVNAKANSVLSVYAGYTRLAQYKIDAISDINSFIGYEWNWNLATNSDYAQDTLAQIQNLQDLYANYINAADSYEKVDSYVDAYNEKVDTYKTIKEAQIAKDADDVNAAIDRVVKATIGNNSLTPDQTTLINRIVADLKARVKSGENFPWNWDSTLSETNKDAKVSTMGRLQHVLNSAGVDDGSGIDDVVSDIINNYPTFNSSALYGYIIDASGAGDAYAVYNPSGYGQEKYDLDKYAGYLSDASNKTGQTWAGYLAEYDKYVALCDAVETQSSKEYKEAVKAAEAAINALGTVENTKAFEAKLKTAKDALDDVTTKFNAMLPAEQAAAAKVSNEATYDDAVYELAHLKYLASLSATPSVLPTVNAFYDIARGITDPSVISYYTKADQNKILEIVTTARDAIDAATTDAAKVELAEKAIADLKAIIPAADDMSDYTVPLAANKDEAVKYFNKYYKAAFTSDAGTATALIKDILAFNEQFHAPDESLVALKAEVKGTHMKIFSSAKKGYIKISWKKSNSNVALDGVEVYRSTKKTSGFKKISTFKKQTAKKYTKNLKKGTKYYFYVKGYKMVGDEKVYTHKSITVARTFRK